MQSKDGCDSWLALLMIDRAGLEMPFHCNKEVVKVDTVK